MWCFIYRSSKKLDCYLYIAKENDFSHVPESLMLHFGKPIFVMKLLLNDKRKMMAATPTEIGQRIVDEGYFLQMLNETYFRIE